MLEMFNVGFVVSVNVVSVLCKKLSFTCKKDIYVIAQARLQKAYKYYSKCTEKYNFRLSKL